MSTTPAGATSPVDLRVATAPWARVGATHLDGERVEVRADGHGVAELGALRPGPWTVVAHDARRRLCSEDVVVEPDAAGGADLTVEATLSTARLLVEVGGSDRRPVGAREVRVTDPTGRCVTARLRDGLAEVGGLRPGPLVVAVAASVGHRGAETTVTAAPGELVATRVVSPVSATLCGRVVQGGRQYAALVTLLDPDGEEIERVRTDEHGRFVLGTGLVTTQGLTVVATTGPETLHVTRAAVAEVDVRTGVRHDLGDIALPVGGPRAVWTARARATASWV